MAVATVIGVVVAFSGHPWSKNSASATNMATQASQGPIAAPSLVPLSALAANDPCLSAIATIAALEYQLGSDLGDPSKAVTDIQRTIRTIQDYASAARTPALKHALADALTHLQALLADVAAGDPNAAQSPTFLQIGNDSGQISAAC
ncbi:MAG TPA: hypothetical protein VFN97_17160 [Actinospica sp.]|nr:hypothetical protein [Actinospica sp.]